MAAAGEVRGEEPRERRGVGRGDIAEEEAEGEEGGDAVEGGLGDLRGAGIEREEERLERGLGDGARTLGMGGRAREVEGLRRRARA